VWWVAVIAVASLVLGTVASVLVALF